MEYKKYFIWGGVVLLIVLIFGIYFPRPNNDGVTKSYVASFVEEALSRLGAIPGTVVNSQFFSIGGLEFVKIGKPLVATSSVICSFKNPFGKATTSIDAISLHWTSSFVAAVEYTVSTSTSGYATSSNPLVIPVSVGAGAKETMSRNFGNDLFLKADEYLNFKIASSSHGNEKPTGTCGFQGTKL